MRRASAVAAFVAAVCAPAALGAFEDEEAKNYSKTNERYQHLTRSPSSRPLLHEKGIAEELELAQIAAARPRAQALRQPLRPARRRLRRRRALLRLGQAARATSARPVLWTARSGATISGHVWAVAGGPQRRKPGVVITNGSVQAPEQLYWAQAAALARAGYVVLTWDPQTQGRSDGPGRGADRRTRTRRRSRRERSPRAPSDALDFFLSTPAGRSGRATAARGRPSTTAPSRTGGWRRAATPPSTRCTRCSTASASASPGNSLGALGGLEGRLRRTRASTRVVAWDQLRVADGAAPIPPTRCPASACRATTASARPAVRPASRPGRTARRPTRRAPTAPRASSARAAATPHSSTRAPARTSSPSLIPNAGFGATLRGIDQYGLVHDRLVRQVREGRRASPTACCSPTAGIATSRRRRWIPTGDGNLFSEYLRSRVDFRRADGSRALCEDVRSGCGLLAPDGLPVGTFSVLDYAYGRQRLAPRASPLRRRGPRPAAARPLALAPQAEAGAHARPAHPRPGGPAPRRTQAAFGSSLALAAGRQAQADPARVAPGRARPLPADGQVELPRRPPDRAPARSGSSADHSYVRPGAKGRGHGRR